MQFSKPLDPRPLWQPMLVAVLSATAGQLIAAEAARPNIVFILADDLGYAEVSFNGQRRYATPNIDRLAAEGLVMTSHYAGSPVCAPSRNTLLTGQHTGRTAIRGNWAGGGTSGRRVSLAANDVTVAQRLRSVGYTTALIGKWGLGEADTPAAPWLLGWDHFFGFVNQAHAHNQFPEFLYRDSTPVPLVENFSHKQGVYANDLFTTEAEGFLDRAAAAKRPFMLYLSYTTPHADLACPPDAIATAVGRFPQLTEPGVTDSSRAFAAMMLRLDRDVGRILDRLKSLGLDQNTLVVFTGDNGAHAEDGKDPAYFASSGSFRGIKRDLYEGGIRVPFVAWWPGRITPGTRSDHQAAFWDFPATALELAGVARPPDLPREGISYAPTLLGRDGQQSHAYLYWEVYIGGKARQAVREGNWKAVRYSFEGPIELYDLGKETAEQTDLAGKHPELVGHFAQRFVEAHEPNPDFPTSEPKARSK